MDKNELYGRVEKAFNQAFDATKASIKVVSEKAGEAAQITKLMIEKVSLEHKVSKKFAEIGSLVYEQTEKKGEPLNMSDESIKKLIQQTKALDAELQKVEASLEQERKAKKKENKDTTTEAKSSPVE